MKQRESVVLRECLSCLAHHGFDIVPPRTHYLFPWREGAKGIIWRSNTGAGWHVDRRTGRIGARPVYYGLPGSPDLLGFCVHQSDVKAGVLASVVKHRAQIIGIECKTESGRLSENQKMFQDWMKNAGGIYIVARSYEECDGALRSYGI